MIKTDNLKKHYENGLVPALDGVSFEVQKGEIVALMGPSGCGKSTLLNIIGAMDTPTEGEVWYAGKRLPDYRPSDRFRAKYIGFIFQFHHLIPTMTLLENVEAPMIAISVPRRKRLDKAMVLLAEMGLGERAHFFPTNISGGERQRAAIARALANEPQVILADEPTGNLDTETGERVFGILMDRCRISGKTLLIATHNPDIAFRTDRLLTMRNGRIIEDKKTSETSGARSL